MDIKKYFWVLTIVLWAGSLAMSQVNIPSIVQEAQTSGLKDQPYPTQFSFVVEKFLNYPYEDKTLEVNKDEALVIYTDGFDCVTLIENVLSVCQVIDAGEEADQFETHLQENRYYAGLIDGYESRIHYFSAWLQSGANRGLLGSITEEIGEEYGKPINFISQNLDKYPKVTRPELIIQRETELNSAPVWYLPQAQIDRYLQNAHSGDILAFTTNIKGLDVVHTGFSWVENEEVYLLHASSKKGKVVKMPLAPYLRSYNYMTGLIVYRPTL